MADKKISDLTLLSSADPTDMLPIVDVSANLTKRVPVSGIAAAVAANLPDGSVEPGAIEFGSSTSKVVTSEATTSTSFTSLATAGPSAAVTVPDNGRLTVSLSASINSGSTGQAGRAAFTLSGANTRAAQDDEAIETQSIFSTCSRTVSLSGLTPGATTVTMVYLTTSGASSASFRRRSLTVTPGI